MDSFATELVHHRQGALGIVVLGDLNTRHQHWLVHSNGTNAAGRVLYTQCLNPGLRQTVTQPTRDNHLLDLVLTDSADVRSRVLPKLADHSPVLATLTFELGETTTVTRDVWDFANADWDKLNDLLDDHSWEFLDQTTTDEATQRLTC